MLISVKWALRFFFHLVGQRLEAPVLGLAGGAAILFDDLFEFRSSAPQLAVATHPGGPGRHARRAAFGRPFKSPVLTHGRFLRSLPRRKASFEPGKAQNSTQKSGDTSPAGSSCLWRTFSGAPE